MEEVSPWNLASFQLKWVPRAVGQGLAGPAGGGVGVTCKDGDDDDETTSRLEEAEDRDSGERPSQPDAETAGLEVETARGADWHVLDAGNAEILAGPAVPGGTSTSVKRATARTTTSVNRPLPRILARRTGQSDIIPPLCRPARAAK